MLTYQSTKQYKITKYFLQQNKNEKSLQYQILHTLHIILHQNNFQFI
jgi:hypothetical protein